MAKFSHQQIRESARKLLGAEPKGLRYMQLIKKIHALAPDTPINSVHGGVYSLVSISQEVVRPSKGLWVLKKFVDSESFENQGATNKGATDSIEIPKKSGTKYSEEMFYEPFANWLRGEDEVVESLVLGGSSFKTKWGTPDVVGVYKSKNSDFVKFPLEIVTAEIKIDISQSVTAFGQACAYRLFSHKAYVVLPTTISNDDRERLEALCFIYGIGLVVFEMNSTEPDFQRIVKARWTQPDMFYTNQFARRLQEVNKTGFDRIF